MPHAVIVDRSHGLSWRLAGGEVLPELNGWDLTVITDRPSPRLPTGICEKVIGVFDDERIRKAVRVTHQSTPIDRISTISEHYLGPIAELRDELGIAGNTAEYTGRIRDKWEMKTAALRAGIAHASGVIAADFADWSPPDRHGRFVIKPRDESGSNGVQFTTGQRETSDVIGDLRDPKKYLVEQYLAADMLHVDGIVSPERTELLVSQYLRPCASTGGNIPTASHTAADSALVERAVAFVKRIIAAWPIYFDVVHCELFVMDGELVLCEIAARPGGAGVSDIFLATRGADLRHAKTALDLGLQPRWGAPVAAHGGWTVLYSPKRGPAIVHDEHVEGHRIREVRSLLAPDLVDVVRVPQATYTFAAESVEEVRSLIDHYERTIVVTPAAKQ